MDSWIPIIMHQNDQIIYLIMHCTVHLLSIFTITLFSKKKICSVTVSTTQRNVSLLRLAAVCDCWQCEFHSFQIMNSQLVCCLSKVMNLVYRVIYHQLLFDWMISGSGSGWFWTWFIDHKNLAVSARICHLIGFNQSNVIWNYGWIM